MVASRSPGSSSWPCCLVFSSGKWEPQLGGDHCSLLSGCPALALVCLGLFLGFPRISLRLIAQYFYRAHGILFLDPWT